MHRLGLRGIIGAVAFWLTLPALAASPYCAGGKSVTIAALNWESASFITEVLRTLIAQGYGCTVETLPGNTVLLEHATAVDQTQILPEEWIGRDEVWRRAEAAGQVKAVGQVFTGGVDGWFVPAYVTEGDAEHGVKPTAPDLKSVAQLKDPAYVTLFADPEEPGRGRFLNCPSGFSCEGANTGRLEAYGLDKLYVNFRPGTGAALDAAILSAYLRRQPILFAYWAPSSIAGRLKLVRLEEAPYDEACWKNVTTPGVPHPKPCGFPQAIVRYGVSRAFAEAAPDLVALLDRAVFPIEELNRRLADMAERKAGPADEAARFLREKPEIWRPWLPDEAARDAVAAAIGHS